MYDMYDMIVNYCRFAKKVPSALAPGIITGLIGESRAGSDRNGTGDCPGLAADYLL